MPALALRLIGSRIAAVEEPVARPGDVRDLDPLQRVVQRLLRGELDDVVFLPVRSARRLAVDRVLRVLRRAERGQRHRAGLRAPRVRIDEDLRRALESLLEVEHALILQAVVLSEEDVLRLPGRRRVALVIVQRAQPRRHRAAVRDAVEIAERDLVLRFDPRRGFGRVVVLQPPVGIGDLDAMIGVDVVRLPRLRIGQRLLRDGSDGQDRE